MLRKVSSLIPKPNSILELTNAAEGKSNATSTKCDNVVSMLTKSRLSFSTSKWDLELRSYLLRSHKFTWTLP